MNFKVGDMAVYPAQGVGVIQAIENRQVGESAKEVFYVLRILDTGVVIRIPRSNAVQVGLRCVMDTGAVTSVYKILKVREVEDEPKPWNRRYRQYMDKLKSGSPYEIAEVLRNLLLLKADKVLSFGERKMLDTARALLVKEISVARDMPVEAVEADLRRFINL
jgi:CarD family transcriptional regulator